MSSFAYQFAHAFPPPDFLSMPAAGIDISDSSVKYLDAQFERGGYIPKTFDLLPIEPGVVVDGVVRDKVRLAEVLAVLRKKHGRRFAYAALPEELVYIYSISLPRSLDARAMRSAVEFSLAEHVPLSPEQVSFDFDIAHTHGDEVLVSVTVFPLDVVRGYKEALEGAGFTVKALELEAYAVARAVVPRHHTGAAMVIDFGRTRTGITIVQNRTPVFSTTVKIGGAAITDTIVQAYGVSLEDADAIKRDEGITHCKDASVCAILVGQVDALTKEIERHYRFWESQVHERGAHDSEKITRIFLCGGAVGLKGLSERVSSVLQVPVRNADIWNNMFDINTHVPSIHHTTSLQYATAAGLLLRDIEI